MRRKALWLIFQEKPAKLLLFLKDSGKKVYQTEISRKIDTTFAHTLKILDIMENSGLITSEKAGKLRFVSLTDIGQEVASHVDTIGRLIEIAELNQKIDEIYASAVKGKIPAEIDREGLKKEYLAIKKRLSNYFSDKNQFIAIKSRKVAARIDLILAEVLGLPPGTEFTLEG